MEPPNLPIHPLQDCSDSFQDMAQTARRNSAPAQPGRRGVEGWKAERESRGVNGKGSALHGIGPEKYDFFPLLTFRQRKGKENRR